MRRILSKYFMVAENVQRVLEFALHSKNGFRFPKIGFGKQSVTLSFEITTRSRKSNNFLNLDYGSKPPNTGRIHQIDSTRNCCCFLKFSMFFCKIRSIQFHFLFASLCVSHLLHHSGTICKKLIHITFHISDN